jgi:hypothetical protein
MAFTGRFLLGLWRLDSDVLGPHFRRRLRCLRHLDGGGFRGIEFGDALLGPLPDRRGWHWATIACRVTVQSPRWAFPPRLPGGPTAAGHFFAILNYQEDRWQCLPADSATSMQLRIREPIGSSLGESSIRARWVYGEPATRCGGFDGRALFR